MLDRNLKFMHILINVLGKYSNFDLVQKILDEACDIDQNGVVPPLLETEGTTPTTTQVNTQGEYTQEEFGYE